MTENATTENRLPTALIGDVILTGGFIVLLWLPIAGNTFNWEAKTRLTEKRVLAECPVLGEEPLEVFPKKFGDFYNDHFGFRTALVNWHAELMLDGLRVSTSEKVILGQGKWLYYTGAGHIDDYQGLAPLTPQQLTRWKNVLEGKQAWLASRGIHYQFIVAPNKASVYPEYLPPMIRKHKGRSRLDQLVDFLQRNSHVEILDLRGVEREGKSLSRTYHPHDTHWTDWGSMLGYRAICRSLSRRFPEIQPLPWDNFTVVSDRQLGALPLMLGRPDEAKWLPCYRLVPRVPFKAKPAQLVLPPGHPWPRTAGWNDPVAKERDDAKLRLLVFQDSFLNHLPRECLAEHFRRSVFLHGRADFDVLRLMVRQERPHIVLEEKVERSLMAPPPDHPQFATARRLKSGTFRR